jgi:hypothetical protein
MALPTLPTEYILEIRDDASTRKEVPTFVSSTPFQSFSKGDFIDPGMWADNVDLPAGRVYEIQYVLHRIYKIGDSHNTHQIEIHVIPAIEPRKVIAPPATS